MEIGESPVESSDLTAADGTGSNVDIIETMLEDETVKQLARGWKDNVDRGVSVVLTAGWDSSLSDAIDIRATAQSDRFCVRGQTVFDKESNATATGTVVLDIARNIAFEECSQRLKEVILAHTIKRALKRFSPGDFSLRYPEIVDRILVSEYTAEPAWEDRHPLNGAKPYARTLGRDQ